jgi:hypothetical protein
MRGDASQDPQIGCDMYMLVVEVGRCDGYLRGHAVEVHTQGVGDLAELREYVSAMYSH